MTVERPTFNTTRLEGYNYAQVDAAVDRLMEDLSLAQPSIDPSEVAQMGFEPMRFRTGYVMAEVDDWLDEVIVALGGSIHPTVAASAPALAPALAPGIVVDNDSATGRPGLIAMVPLLLIVVVLLYIYFT